MTRCGSIAWGMTVAILGASPVAAEEREAETSQPEALSVEVSPAAKAPAEYALLSAAAEAQEKDDGWNVIFTPYLWVAGTKGDIATPRSEGTGSGGIEVDKSFTDILGNLNFAFMGAIEAEHKRFVLLGDLMYLSVSAKAKGIREPGFFEGKGDFSILATTGAVGYRVVDKGPMFVDLIVGARLVSIDVDLELTGPLETRELGASPSHVAPVFGGRARFPLGKKWGLALYGDAAGIKDSEVKWQLVGTIQRDLGKHWRLAAGYRHMQIHHDKERLDFDMALSGPIVGFNYKF